MPDGPHTERERGVVDVSLKTYTLSRAHFSGDVGLDLLSPGERPDSLSSHLEEHHGYRRNRQWRGIGSVVTKKVFMVGFFGGA